MVLGTPQSSRPGHLGCQSPIDKRRPVPIFRASNTRHCPRRCADGREFVMKVRNSLKSLRSRHRNNQLVRRRGRVYVINKTQRRFKARQG